MLIKILPIVAHGQPQPVHLNINGESVELPVNTDIEVTDEQFLALGHSDHAIQILVEGSTAADEAEQAPAPAGSGDGGDAGGGGDSGDAATDTSEEETAEQPEQADDEEAAEENAETERENVADDAEADETADEQPDAEQTGDEQPTADDSLTQIEALLPKGFHDRSVPAIVADLPGLTPAQLVAAKALEEAGKTRSTLMAALDEAIAAKAQG
jgi:hypothetical protein